MPELLSPFAPVHNWLCRALRIGWDGSRLQSRGFAVHFREPPEREELDLRDFITRAATLRALTEAGHPRPWALGSCWSSLNDEQAGRVTAEVVRQVGEDPRRPVGVLPACLLGPWRPDPSIRTRWWRYDRRRIVAGQYPWSGGQFADSTAAYPLTRKPRAGDAWRGGERSGPDHGDAGRDASDIWSVAAGALLWEQVTPSEKADV